VNTSKGSRGSKFRALPERTEREERLRSGKTCSKKPRTCVCALTIVVPKSSWPAPASPVLDSATSTATEEEEDSLESSPGSSAFVPFFLGVLSGDAADGATAAAGDGAASADSEDSLGVGFLSCLGFFVDAGAASVASAGVATGDAFLLFFFLLNMLPILCTK